ncbi:response regulator transcription factor [Alloacidobacterium dinghuense]|uniref:Response regulator transcription factor n=1 Tax=Alloacidobacterium dinghuense TaxID=2763107 RepID=A0A7G8BDH3_9BACT|nr:response regulator transcription factor [Alloacidobacterium dinghuense]QNI30593.1 response regulator transcription factor [Alloacidobacterium dinghuense]
MIRCVIADDHSLVRQALLEVLARDGGIHFVGAFEDAGQAAACAVRERADILILDVAMPGYSPFDASRLAKKSVPSLKVVFLSGYSDDIYIRRAIEAGAHAYVLKSSERQELRIAIEKAHRGEKHIPMADRFFNRPIEESGADYHLTVREREVLKLLAQGKTVKDVAIILGLSGKTVESHKTNLMRKLDLHNKAELVQYAVAHKIIFVNVP